MEPVYEQALRRWITKIISQEGYSLRKTPRDHPDFKRLGKWSRWVYDKATHRTVLVETHVDLEDLAGRCAVHRNARTPRGDALPKIPLSFEPKTYQTDYIYKPPLEPPNATEPKPLEPQLSLFKGGD